LWFIRFCLGFSGRVQWQVGSLPYGGPSEFPWRGIFDLPGGSGILAVWHRGCFAWLRMARENMDFLVVGIYAVVFVVCVGSLAYSLHLSKLYQEKLAAYNKNVAEYQRQTADYSERVAEYKQKIADYHQRLDESKEESERRYLESLERQKEQAELYRQNVDLTKESLRQRAEEVEVMRELIAALRERKSS
jgi:hypothetical protein